MELLKDYDISILYHPDKANVVVDSLRRLSIGCTSYIEEQKRELPKDMHRLVDSIEGGIVLTNGAESYLVS